MSDRSFTELGSSCGTSVDATTSEIQPGTRLFSHKARGTLAPQLNASANIQKVRSFAYLILKKPCEAVAVRAARACIATQQHPLAVSILERISESSTVDYVLLRIFLAWRQDRASIAELFFSKIGSFDNEDAKENAVNLFYDIGLDHLNENRYEEAKKWLERAYNILQKWDLTSIFDGLELRLNVLHTYARSLFLQGQDDMGRIILNTLRSDYPHRLPVLLLQMEYHAGPDDLQTILKETIQTMQLMDSTFKLVIHHLHVLRQLDLDRAVAALTYFIFERLIPEGTKDWTEAAFMTLVWMVVQDADDCGREKELVKYFDAFHEIHQSNRPLLSQEADQAATVLLWKHIERVFQKNPSAAAKWCQAACLILKGANEQNIAKIKRKQVACYIAAKNWEQAQHELDHMPDFGKADNLTRFLNYTVTIRSDDQQAAERALNTLASTPKDAEKLLFACVSESNEHGSPSIQAKLLQHILDKYSNEPHPDVNFCALLRATARLLWQVLEQSQDEVDEEILDRLCAIFKAAENYSVNCNGEKAVIGGAFDELECEWFSKNGYNLGLQKVQQWPVQYVVRILESVGNIVYPKDIDQDVLERRQNRNTGIAYARIVLYTMEARNGDEAAYTKIMTVYNYSVANGKHNQDFTSLLPLIFEAAIHSIASNRQETLGFLLSILASESPKVYAACANLILTSALKEDEICLPIDSAVALLGQIISHLRVLPGYDLAQASKWIRCMVQLIREKSGKTLVEDPSLALLESIIDETAQLVQTTTYPGEELEWLATTIFNLAVDLYLAEKDDSGKQMAGRSLLFATAMEDRGLEVILRDKMRKIGW